MRTAFIICIALAISSVFSAPCQTKQQKQDAIKPKIDAAQATKTAEQDKAKSLKSNAPGDCPSGFAGATWKQVDANDAAAKKAVDESGAWAIVQVSPAGAYKGSGYGYDKNDKTSVGGMGAQICAEWTDAYNAAVADIDKYQKEFDAATDDKCAFEEVNGATCPDGSAVATFAQLKAGLEDAKKAVKGEWNIVHVEVGTISGSGYNYGIQEGDTRGCGSVMCATKAGRRRLNKKH